MFHSREPGRWTIRRLLSLAVVALVCRGVAAEETGYPKEISVREPTRLDWVFAVANQSVLDPPAEWLQGYGSAKQRYELLVPATAKKKPKTKNKTADALPLVLFISAGDQPAGWSQVQVVCQQNGVGFASPFGTGNNTPMPRSIRKLLDVLDDLRR